VPVHAAHNAWGETAADEAWRTDRASCRKLLLANAKCFSLEDRDRLAAFKEDPDRPPALYARRKTTRQGAGRGMGVAGAPSGGGARGLGAGGERGPNAFGGGGEDDDNDDDDDDDDENDGAELKVWKGYVEDETGYPSDDERICDDAEALATVLRKRHSR
jgi:hypothetical protein